MVLSLVLSPLTIIRLGVVEARGSIPSTQSLTIIRLGVVGARGPIPSTPSLTIIRLGVVVQGGKTFCASFCASLIAGSRRAFLCVDRVCLLEF